MNNKVSIIIPCYNHAEYLPETLDSVLAQTYKNWECIVVDDGSVDKSRDVVQEYISKDSRFTYLYQDNQGPSAARNNGIRHSCGEFILPIDADDLIAATYLEKAIKAFITHPQLKLVYCKVKFFGERNRIWELPDYSYEGLLWENMIFCSAMYKRNDYDKTCGYNSNMRAGLEDWDFWLSMIGPADIVYCINEILFFYRIKRSSRDTHAEENRHALLRQIYTNHPEKYEPYIKDIIYFKQQERRLQEHIKMLQQKSVSIIESTDYRLGAMLLRPLRWLREIVHRL